MPGFNKFAPKLCQTREWDQPINLCNDASGFWNFPQLQINSNEKESWSKFFWNPQSSRLLQMKNSADEFRVWFKSNHIQSAWNKVALRYCPGIVWILPHPWKGRSIILGCKSEHKPPKGFLQNDSSQGKPNCFVHPVLVFNYVRSFNIDCILWS